MPVEDWENGWLMQETAQRLALRNIQILTGSDCNKDACSAVP